MQWKWSDGGSGLEYISLHEVPGIQKHSRVVLRAHVCLTYLWVCGFVIIVHSKKPPLAIASACSSLFGEHSLGYSLSCKKECIPATCILCTKSSFNLSCSFHYSIISFFFSPCCYLQSIFFFLHQQHAPSASARNCLGHHSIPLLTDWYHSGQAVTSQNGHVPFWNWWKWFIGI